MIEQEQSRRRERKEMKEGVKNMLNKERRAAHDNENFCLEIEIPVSEFKEFQLWNIRDAVSIVSASASPSALSFLLCQGRKLDEKFKATKKQKRQAAITAAAGKDGRGGVRGRREIKFN